MLLSRWGNVDGRSGGEPWPEYVSGFPSCTSRGKRVATLLRMREKYGGCMGLGGGEKEGLLCGEDEGQFSSVLQAESKDKREIWKVVGVFNLGDADMLPVWSVLILPSRDAEVP